MWRKFWERMFWFAVEKRTEKQLGTKPSVNIGMWLGSGYSVERDMNANIEKLKNVCNAVVTDKKFEAKNGETYCNFAFWEVAAEMGYEEFRAKKMTANQIIRHIEESNGWRKTEPEVAHAFARNGGLAVAGKKYPKHGHIAAVFPTSAMLFSGSLNKYVPVLANVGRTNGIMKASECFPVSEGEPDYWCWG